MKKYKRYKRSISKSVRKIYKGWKKAGLSNNEIFCLYCYAAIESNKLIRYRIAKRIYRNP